MKRPHEFDPFWSLIDKALTDRKKNPASHDKHPEHSAPQYVVALCEALLGAIHAQGNRVVNLQDVVRLEATCTGSDYQYKLALRCSRLASGVAS
uniref:hypothetical protein n=1 Tax=Pseudomonas aeruginosa TaxID=287 RepID=UPI0009388B6B|nr:hypothetical protein [Pseudomonas aeruginosa]